MRRDRSFILCLGAIMTVSVLYFGFSAHPSHESLSSSLSPSQTKMVVTRGRDGTDISKILRSDQGSASTGQIIASERRRVNVMHVDKHIYSTFRSQGNSNFLHFSRKSPRYLLADEAGHSPIANYTFKLVPHESGSDHFELHDYTNNMAVGLDTTGSSGGFFGAVAVLMPSSGASGAQLHGNWLTTPKIARFRLVFRKGDDSAGFLVLREGEERGVLAVAGESGLLQVVPFAERGPSSVFSVRRLTLLELRQAEEEWAKYEQYRRKRESRLLGRIQQLPTADEYRVISFGLYGSSPKYTTGAIRNAELAKLYYPGWVCRYYLDHSVPQKVVKRLVGLGAEVVDIEQYEYQQVYEQGQQQQGYHQQLRHQYRPAAEGGGYGGGGGTSGTGGTSGSTLRGEIGGMFWRFLVADDPRVDRFIVRDTDSRLNARERFAVEDWIRSKKKFHLMRDHVNHDRPINGGMWGAVRGAISVMKLPTTAPANIPGSGSGAVGGDGGLLRGAGSGSRSGGGDGGRHSGASLSSISSISASSPSSMGSRVKRWGNKDEYMADLHFLNEEIWPLAQDMHIAHDAYFCLKYPHSRPFPTRRSQEYEHVGQVFDEFDNPRWDDIDRFTRNREVPRQCRGKEAWIYG